jgi:hypothetical protein
LFRANVKKARKENKRITGAADRVPDGCRAAVFLIVCEAKSVGSG